MNGSLYGLFYFVGYGGDMLNWIRRLINGKKKFIVRYWYYDRLGMPYVITTTHVKLYDTKDYVQAQDLSHSQYKLVERYYGDGYIVKFGFWGE